MYPSCAVCKFSCIRVYKRVDDGLLLDPNHVAVNKMIKSVLCATDLMHVVVIC